MNFNDVKNYKGNISPTWGKAGQGEKKLNLYILVVVLRAPVSQTEKSPTAL